MTLSVALVNALGGLRVAQVGVQWTSQNVGNLNTDGYTKKVVNQESVAAGGVRVASVDRFVDEGMLRQLRAEQTKLGTAQIAEEYLSRLGDFLGDPAYGGTVGRELTGLSEAFEALATSPRAIENLVSVRDGGVMLARSINASSDHIQELRTEVDREIAGSIQIVNEALAEVQRLNYEIAQMRVSGQPTGEHEDQRDMAINRIAEQIPIRTFEKESGQTGLFLPSGLALLDGTPRFFSEYTAHATITAAVPRDFQAITFATDTGTDATPLIQGGKLGELIKLRDSELPRFQTQLDALATQLRDQINAQHNLGTPQPPRDQLVASQTFDSDNVDFTFASGNTHLVLFDADGKEQAVIDFAELSQAGANNPTPLPASFTMRDLLTTLNDYLPANTTAGGVALSDIIRVPPVPPAGPSSQVALGFEVSSGYPGYGLAIVDEAASGNPTAKITLSATSLATSTQAFGFSNLFGFNDFFVGEAAGPSWGSATQPEGYKVTSGGTISLMTSRGSYQVVVNPGDSLDDIASTIETSFPDEIEAYVYRQGDSFGLRIGSDASPPMEIYDISTDITGLPFSRQEVGTSGELAVRQDIVDNPHLVSKGRPVRDVYHHYDLGAGDGAIAQKLAETFNTGFAYPSVGGLPEYTTTFHDFNAQLVGQIAGAADRAGSELEFQTGFTNMLEQRISEASGVNIDEELTNMVKLQNAYAASARVITAVQEMFDILENL